MSAIAHISRVFAVLFALLALVCVAMPFLKVFGGTYEGGYKGAVMLITCYMYGGLFGVVGAALYGCHRYVRSEERGRPVKAFIWFCVALTVISGSAMATRFVWVAVPSFTR